jgi:subtilase family serine protease
MLRPALRRVIARAPFLTAALAAAVATTLAVVPGSASAAGRVPGHPSVALHPLVTTPGKSSSAPHPPPRFACLVAYGSDCLRPIQVRTAYNVDTLVHGGTTGKGVTIALVDSFGSPTIQADLKTYDRAFHIPDPPSFQVVQPAGPVPAYDGSSDREGWAGEATLDVEWAHTMAPGAKLLLVETPTSETEGIAGFPDIIKALQWIVDTRAAQVISMSFGATEGTFQGGAATLKKLSKEVLPAARAAHITVVAASGDEGATDYTLDMKHLSKGPVTSWPASDPLVTAVGGATLHVDAGGKRTEADSAWGGTGAAGAGGGGLSKVFPRPAFQNGVRSVVGNHRGVPDVSMNASGESPVLTWQSFDGSGEPGWQLTYGTSESAPLFAGIVALADQAAKHALGWLNPALYSLAHKKNSGIVDIKSGRSDLVSAQIDTGSKAASFHGYPAATGYDLATGLGTLDAKALVQALSKAKPG